MSTELLNSDPTSIARACEILSQDGIVALPTETVYGLAANALSEHAVLKIFKAKERPSFDPLIVHVPGPLAKWESWVAAGWLSEAVLAPDVLRSLAAWAKTYWPGPLTLILPKGPSIPDVVTSGQPTVGIRMPNSEAMQKILNKIAFPLAAPSANRFGRISPTTADHVLTELDGRIDAILDGGPCSIGVESTIVRPVIQKGKVVSIEVLRPGAIDAADLAATSKIRLNQPPSLSQSGSNKAPIAPGMLESHYAPRTPMEWDTAGKFQAPPHLSLAILELPLPPEGAAGLQPQQKALHRARLSSDPHEAAHQLYSTLRELDGLQADLILVLGELPNPKEHPLWQSILDRLTRASHR